MRRSTQSEPTRRADVPTGQGEHQAEAKPKSEEIRTDRDPEAHMASGIEQAEMLNHLREPASLVDEPRAQQPEPSIEPAAPTETGRQAESAAGFGGNLCQGNVERDLPVEAGPVKASRSMTA